jgi:hypothetical protein
LQTIFFGVLEFIFKIAIFIVQAFYLDNALLDPIFKSDHIFFLVKHGLFQKFDLLFQVKFLQFFLAKSVVIDFVIIHNSFKVISLLKRLKNIRI